MALFPRFYTTVQSNVRPSRQGFPTLFRNVLALGLAALLFLVPLGFNVSAQQPASTPKSSYIGDSDVFMLYRNEEGETVCREATMDEKRELGRINTGNQGLRQINHLERGADLNSGATNANGESVVAVANLTIILRSTAQLDSFPDAKAAFIRAAAAWESQVLSPVTLYMDVDYGTTFFGQTWESGVIGATSSPSTTATYSGVRNNLIAGASTPAESSLYNSLPTGSLPMDTTNASSVSVSSSIARAIGIFPATANPTDTAARIAFNSNFQFDFNPTDGITGNRIDFEAVATHEIGHALGFTSRAGNPTATAPAIWDLFRFRTGTTLSTFGTAQRIMTASGLQYYFSGTSELALSTGGPDGEATGGDGNQSSHWKEARLNNGVYVGIMDPRIPNNTRRIITANDTLALNAFGYNLDNSNPPPPPPPPPAAPANNAFASAQAISGCTATVNATNIGATKESGEPSHNPDPSGHPGSASVWYQWQSPSTGSVTVTTNGGQTNYDTMLGVYTGNSVNGLSVLGRNDDIAQGNTNSSVTFNATTGTIYKIAVDGWGGETGNFTLNLTANNCTVATNPIDGAQFFVDRHYQDFLGRSADASGLQYWTEQITGNSSNSPVPCNAGDAVCVHVRRISVSAAFFVENEFQRTGGFVVRFYKASYGTRPTFQQFNTDRSQVFEGAGLEARKTAFAASWIQRSEFTAKYPTSLGGPAFVDAMILNVQQNSGVNLSSRRASLIDDFNAGGRAQVVRSIADDTTFAAAEYNPAFVTMQYFGYLQRSPDEGGYQFWLGVLNNRAPNNFRAMVCAFLTSAEYQQRFGTTITRSNNDCSFVGP